MLVEVVATSFNPVGAGIRAGYLRQVFAVSLPHIPGIDVAGTVVALGAGVTRWAVGDRAHPAASWALPPSPVVYDWVKLTSSAQLTKLSTARWGRSDAFVGRVCRGWWGARFGCCEADHLLHRA